MNRVIERDETTLVCAWVLARDVTEFDILAGSASVVLRTSTIREYTTLTVRHNNASGEGIVSDKYFLAESKVRILMPVSY